MGTYARYSLVTEALSCFLQQTALDDAMLLIYNQHPVPLTFDHPRVRVVNETPPKQALRYIRKRMIDLTRDDDIEFLHLWDDDDLYLPWHLEDCLAHIGEAVAWKPKRSWFSERNTIFKFTENFLEASWLVRADCLRMSAMDAHPDYMEHPFFMETLNTGSLRTTELGDLTSYIYRWDTGTQHVSGYGYGNVVQQAENIEKWREGSTDVRADGRLIPADLRPRWRQFLKGISGEIAPDWNGKLQIDGALGVGRKAISATLSLRHPL